MLGLMLLIIHRAVLTGILHAVLVAGGTHLKLASETSLEIKMLLVSLSLGSIERLEKASKGPGSAKRQGDPLAEQRLPTAQ